MTQSAAVSALPWRTGSEAELSPAGRFPAGMRTAGVAGRPPGRSGRQRTESLAARREWWGPDRPGPALGRRRRPPG